MSIADFLKEADAGTLYNQNGSLEALGPLKNWSDNISNEANNWYQRQFDKGGALHALQPLQSGEWQDSLFQKGGALRALYPFQSGEWQDSLFQKGGALHALQPLQSGEWQNSVLGRFNPIPYRLKAAQEYQDYLNSLKQKANEPIK